MQWSVFAQKKGKVIEEEVFLVVEEMPVFMQKDSSLVDFINSKIKYPELAIINNHSGRVIVSFVVNKNGEVEDVSVVKKTHKELDDEAIRVVSLTNLLWQPGKQNGKTCNVKFTIPISFYSPNDLVKKDFIDFYLKKIDHYEQQNLKSETKNYDYISFKSNYELRFDTTLLSGLKSYPYLFLPRAISIFFLSYFYEMETKSELFMEINKISNYSIYGNSKSKEYFTSKHAWLWWKKNKYDFAKFNLLDDWETRKFNIDFTIQGYEK